MKDVLPENELDESEPRDSTELRAEKHAHLQLWDFPTDLKNQWRKVELPQTSIEDLYATADRPSAAPPSSAGQIRSPVRIASTIDSSDFSTEQSNSEDTLDFPAPVLSEFQAVEQARRHLAEINPRALHEHAEAKAAERKASREELVALVRPPQSASDPDGIDTEPDGVAACFTAKPGPITPPEKTTQATDAATASTQPSTVANIDRCAPSIQARATSEPPPATRTVAAVTPGEWRTARARRGILMRGVLIAALGALAIGLFAVIQFATEEPEVTVIAPRETNRVLAAQPVKPAAPINSPSAASTDATAQTSAPVAPDIASTVAQSRKRGGTSQKAPQPSAKPLTIPEPAANPTSTRPLKGQPDARASKKPSGTIDPETLIFPN